VLAVLSAYFGWKDWSGRDLKHPAGIIVTQQPQQTNLNTVVEFPFKGFQLVRKARFEIRARVLSSEPYYWGTEAKLSPVDLALGWGPMSDQAILDKMEVSQGSRWFFWQYDLPAPISDSTITLNSGNMHIIPQEKWLEKKVKALRNGDIVNLKGYLVDVSDESGFRWTTSMTRKDTGNGACEIFFLESMQLEGKT